MENIESSPDPGSSEDNMSHYKKTIGFADMVGELYEVKTAALLFLRECNKAKNFYLASNMKSAGAFDDIVLRLEHQTIFLQLKHRKNPELKDQKNPKLEDQKNPKLEDQKNPKLKDRKNLKKIQMLQLNQEKGDFSLLRYYKSFCELKEQWEKDKDLQVCGRFEDALFVVYTNMALADGIGNEVDSNAWQHLISTISSGGKCLYLTEDSCPLNSVDPTLYKEFLSQFRFCTEQATERELDILIRQELRIFCGTETMYHHFLSSIENWWRNSNDYLTDKTQFWQDIAHTTKKLNLNFNENECSKIIKMMPQTVRILHVIPQTYNSTKLSYLKMHQSLKNKLMVTSSTLQAHVSEVLALWSRGSCYNVLVVEGGIDNQDVIKGIADVLHSKPDKQLIVIACDPESCKVMPLFQEYQCKVYNDSFLLSQLNNNSYEMAMDCKFNFQGSCINLKSIGGSDVLENVVTGDIVVKLLTGDLKVGDALPPKGKCYITRPLSRSERVDKGIFTSKGHDILAVSGISVQEMQKLVPSGETVITGDVSNQTEANKCRYFVIDNATHFTRLRVLHDNIHWLDKQGSNFLWKATKGDKKFIRNHVTNVTYDNMKDIVNLPDQVVLFVAEPGMGKSTELSHMGLVVKQLNPATWVVRVDLNDHVECLKHDTKASAIDLLMRAGNFNDEFEKSLLKHELLHGGNVVVMFDGFDEISPNYADKVIGMLKELTDTKIKKVCVTSRPVMRKRLEQELLSMHFAFTPFTKENQKTFLLEYWNVSTNDYDMNNFTDELLKRTESSLNDRMSTFTGIPLQTRMLAEAFEIQAKHYSETGEIRLPHSLDLLQLYTSFVDRKWEIYFSEKNKVDIGLTVGLTEVYEYQKKIFLQQHINCAIVTLLDSDEIKQLHDSRDIIEKCNSFLEIFKKGSEKTGIVVDIIDGRAKFSHRTFEEYFVAKWFCENFNSHRNYLQEKLFDSNFQITRNFLNRMLAEKFELHIAVLNHDKDKVQALLQDGQLDVNMRDKGGRTPLHLVVLTYNNEFSEERLSLMQDIMHILFKHGADSNIEEQVFCWRPLRLADRITAWAAVDVLLENHANSSDLIQIEQNINDKEFVQGVLRVASRQGLVKLVEFMLGCGVPVGYRIDATDATMLHVAAEYKQLKLVQFLAEQNADAEPQNSRYKHMDMWAADRGHLEVVKCLIERGATLSAKDWLGNTALLRAAQRGKLEVFKLLAQHDTDVTTSDHNGDTVLHHAAVSGNAELIKYILGTLTLNINCCNKKHQTPLWRAAWYGHSWIVQLLCEHGADLHVKDNEWEWTPLHVAANKGHKKVVQCLVQRGSNVTARDKEGRTPADVAKEDSQDLVEIMEKVAT